MDVKPALLKLKKSSDFKKWKQKNNDTYFSYAFKIPQEMPNEWQFGFYSKKKDMITTFVIADDGIKIRPEEEVFKEEGTKVNEIQLDYVNITFESAVLKANEFQEKNFPRDKSVKTVAILQNLSNLGNVWNITYVTEAFNTLNIKIDAGSGKIVEYNLSSLFSFGKE